MSPLLDIATGWTLFLSITTATGVVVGRWLVLPAGADGLALRRRSARLGLAASLLLLVALGLVLLRQVLEFRDPFVPWREDAHLLLTATDWGTYWIAAVGASLVAALAFGFAAAGRSWGWPLAALAVLPVGFFPGLTGHANAGDLRALTLAADGLHVWAAGGWIGGLALVLFLELERSRGVARGQAAPSLLPVLVPRFSRVAIGSVATLVLTGVVASWVHLEGWGALVTSGYGRILLLKLLLVAAVLALGALNFRVLTPRLSSETGPATLRRAAIAELAIANLVLVLTALLVRTSPL